jgi:hypothetical protein
MAKVHKPITTQYCVSYYNLVIKSPTVFDYPYFRYLYLRECTVSVNRSVLFCIFLKSGYSLITVFMRCGWRPFYVSCILLFVAQSPVFVCMLQRLFQFMAYLWPIFIRGQCG